MRAWMLTLVAVCALLQGGCSKQEEAPAGQPAAGEEPTAGQATGALEEAAEPGDDTAEMAAAKAARAMGTSADEAPVYIKKLFTHIKEITRLTRENLDDCAKAAEVVGAYVDQHQEEMDALSKQAREAAEKMTDTEKMKYAMQVQALFASEMRELYSVQMQFARKCSQQAQEIGRTLSKLKMK